MVPAYAFAELAATAVLGEALAELGGEVGIAEGGAEEVLAGAEVFAGDIEAIEEGAVEDHEKESEV